MSEEKGSVGQVGKCNCPECGATTTPPRLGYHPFAKKLHTAAYWSVSVTFAILVIFTLIGQGFDGGVAIGFQIFAFALGPAIIIVTCSFFFPKVWHLTCASCRTEFYRSVSAETWKVDSG